MATFTDVSQVENFEAGFLSLRVDFGMVCSDNTAERNQLQSWSGHMYHLYSREDHPSGYFLCFLFYTDEFGFFRQEQHFQDLPSFSALTLRYLVSNFQANLPDRFKKGLGTSSREWLVDGGPIPNNRFDMVHQHHQPTSLLNYSANSRQ